MQPLSQHLFNEVALGTRVISAVGSWGFVYAKSTPKSPTDFYVYIEWNSPQSSDTIGHISDMEFIKC